MCSNYEDIRIKRMLEQFHVEEYLAFSNSFYTNHYSQLQVESIFKIMSVRPSVLPSVPLYLLQFLSDSFNIAHRASLQCRGRHG